MMVPLCRFRVSFHSSSRTSIATGSARSTPTGGRAGAQSVTWQEEHMNSKPEISVEPIIKPMEEKISKSAGLAGLKPQPEAVGDVNQSIGALIDKVSATSIAEIEKLVSDLQTVRNYLKAEGDRIQQEMARYAHLSDTASASVKIIAEKLGQWRKGPTMIKTDNVSFEAKHGNSHDF